MVNDVGLFLFSVIWNELNTSGTPQSVNTVVAAELHVHASGIRGCRCITW